MEDSVICEKCGHVLIMGEWPWCPHGSDGHYGVTGDDIPGGVVIQHALYDKEGRPQKFYSKSAIAKAAKAAGLVNIVEHVTDPKSGSDKNPHTTRWI